MENINHHKIVQYFDDFNSNLDYTISSSKLKSCYLFMISFISSHWYRVWQTQFTHIQK